MTMTMRSLVCGVLLIAAVGCGDDDVPPPRGDASMDARNDTGMQDTGGGDTAVTDGRPDGTPGDTSPPDAHDDAPGADGAPDAAPGTFMCTMAQRDYLAANQTMINDDSRSCAIMCISDMDAEGCFYSCMLDAPPDGKGYEMNVIGAGRDMACLSCIAGQLGCIRDHCLGDCFSDSSSMACITCRCENDCYVDFDACAGTTSAATACGT